MDACTDKRFKSWIHLYELDLLSPADREAFEIHLYECEHCFGLIQRYKEQTLMLRHDPDLSKTVADVITSGETPLQKATWMDRFGNIWAKPQRSLVPAAAAVLILLILVLKPWHIEIGPTQDAQAARERVVVMYFANIANPEDPDHLGEIAANLLITDLAQSRFIQVVSGQYLYDLLKSLGHQDDKTPGREIALRVAQKAGAQWLVFGNILRQKPSLVLSAELVDPDTGEIAAAVRVEENGDRGIFALVDRLTTDLKPHFSLPPVALSESTPKISDVTTHSAEAYRYYLDGIAKFYRYYTADAVASFEKALTCDSTFALAYYWLARLKDRRLVDSALAYSDKVTPKERHYIYSLKAVAVGDIDSAMAELKEVIKLDPTDKNAYFQLASYSLDQGQYAQTVEYADSAIAIDSLYAAAYNLLAYGYDYLGNTELSILAINTYIQKSPDEANPYDSRAALYALHGRIDDAIASYRVALEKKPDFLNAIYSLGTMYTYKQDFAVADSLFRLLIDSKVAEFRSSGKLFLALTPAQQGRFTQTIKALDTLFFRGVTGSKPAVPDYVYRVRAFIHRARGDYNAALLDYEKFLTITRDIKPKAVNGQLYFYVQLLAEAGRMNEAEQVGERLVHDSAYAGDDQYTCWYASGAIAFADGRFAKAVNDFEKAAAIKADFPADYMLARAYLENGQLGQAVNLFEKELSVFDSDWRICIPDWRIKMHYYLAVAYEQSRWYDKARQQYVEFLKLWNKADPGMPEIKDAKTRLTRLESIG